MIDFGTFLGILVIVFYVLTMTNFLLKFILRNFNEAIQKNKSFHRFFMKSVKFFYINHRWFGITTFIFILAHFLVLYDTVGVDATGYIAAGLLIIQVSLGASLVYLKPETKIIFWLHRIVGISFVIAIIFHLI